MKVRILSITLLLFSLAGCGMLVDSFSLTDGATHEGGVSLINGRITIGKNCTVTGDLESVNGSITVDDGSQVGGIDNVNGSITLGNTVIVDGGIEAVNGAISAGSEVRIEGDIDNVNGRISLDQGSLVTGAINSVNGGIELVGAEASSIETVNSEIELLAGTRITGSLLVRKSSGMNLGSNSARRVVIGENSEVVGPLTFEKPVELYVHETATVGTIEGAEPIAYTGDAP